MDEGCDYLEAGKQQHGFNRGAIMLMRSLQCLYRKDILNRTLGHVPDRVLRERLMKEYTEKIKQLEKRMKEIIQCHNECVEILFLKAFQVRPVDARAAYLERMAEEFEERMGIKRPENDVGAP